MARVLRANQLKKNIQFKNPFIPNEEISSFQMKGFFLNKFSIIQKIGLTFKKIYNWGLLFDEKENS